MLAQGVATAGWDRADGRVVSRAEDAVEWVLLEPADRPAVVRVSVARAPRQPPLVLGVPDISRSAPPAVTMLAPSWPLPLGPVILGAQPDGSWLADIPVPTGAVAAVREDARRGTLVLDVHDPRIVRRPPSGSEADAALAQRWGARGVWLTRAAQGRGGPAAEELRDTAAQAFRRARNIWSDLASRTSSSDDSVLTDRIALCDSLASHLRSGSTGVGGDLVANDVPTGPPRFGGDLRPDSPSGPIVQLADPGWRPSAAEVLAQER